MAEQERSNREKKKLGFTLFDEDEEDNLPQKLDKSLILLRQIDRINRLASMGDLMGYVNSINQLGYFLSSELDDRYKKELKIELNASQAVKNKYSDDDVAEKLNVDVEFSGQKFKLLCEVLSRKGYI